jgi:hypothetical protein
MSPVAYSERQISNHVLLVNEKGGLRKQENINFSSAPRTLTGSVHTPLILLTHLRSRKVETVFAHPFICYVLSARRLKYNPSCLSDLILIP